MQPWELREKGIPVPGTSPNAVTGAPVSTPGQFTVKRPGTQKIRVKAMGLSATTGYVVNQISVLPLRASSTYPENKF